MLNMANEKDVRFRVIKEIEGEDYEVGEEYSMKNQKRIDYLVRKNLIKLI